VEETGGQPERREIVAARYARIAYDWPITILTVRVPSVSEIEKRFHLLEIFGGRTWT
jgi:hypothetical protein